LLDNGLYILSNSSQSNEHGFVSLINNETPDFPSSQKVPETEETERDRERAHVWGFTAPWHFHINSLMRSISSDATDYFLICLEVPH